MCYYLAAGHITLKMHPTKVKTFDAKTVEHILIRENQFITELFSVLSLPNRTDSDEEDESWEEASDNETEGSENVSIHGTASELQGRLDAINRKDKLTYRDRLTKKNLTQRIKQKMRKAAKNSSYRNARLKLKRAEGISTTGNPEDETGDAGQNSRVKIGKEDQMEKSDGTKVEPISENGMTHETKNKKMKFTKATRAESFTELKERLQVKNKDKNVEKAKKILAKKAAKKAKREEEKKQLKKKKRDEIRVQHKKVKAEQSQSDKNHTEDEKQNNTNMVFSKIDFSDLGKSSNKTIRQDKDPKKILQSLEKQREKLNELRESGETQKAVQIKEKIAWKNALAKAQGKKIKDDPLLLKKTIQKDEQKKRASKRKWEQRQEGVEKAKEERQRKRTENIKKRKTEKKTNKLKKASKKGRIIPGL